MDIQVKTIETDEERESVNFIRREVFIIGLNIPEFIEIDKNEDMATYIIATANKAPVGTARWRITEEGVKLERFAVLDQFRLKGVGRKLTEFILNQFSNNETIFLNSQVTAIDFYQKFGFKISGKLFQEANIMHQKMYFDNKP